MKLALATITLFFFLFTFSTKPSSVRAKSLEPVLDISGQNLLANESYYVSSTIPLFGRLSFNTFPNVSCPHVVVEDWIPFKGNLVKFSPFVPGDQVIYTSSNINIEFSDKISTCNESGVWEITNFTSQARNVATNGTKGSVAPNSNWFTIEKAALPGFYKIMFYPFLDVTEQEELQVFLYDCDWKKYVGYPGNIEELRVRFVKANDTNAIDDVDEAVMSI